MKKSVIFIVAAMFGCSAANAEPPDVKMEAEATGQIVPYAIEGATDSEYLVGNAGNVETQSQYQDDYQEAVRDGVAANQELSEKAAEDAFVEAEVDAASGVDNEEMPVQIVDDPPTALKRYPVCTATLQDHCRNPAAPR
jgi:hypothetical protein